MTRKQFGIVVITVLVTGYIGFYVGQRSQPELTDLEARLNAVESAQTGRTGSRSSGIVTGQDSGVSQRDLD